MDSSPIFRVEVSFGVVFVREIAGIRPMRKFASLAVVSTAMIARSAFAAATDFPSWAYPVNPPAVAQVVDGSAEKHVPDSAVTFTRKQLSTIAGPVSDWHPEEHGAMPAIVGRGRPPQVFACGYCHLPNGAGRPENTSLAGLSPTYIKQQMAAFRNGDRPGSEPKRAPQTNMIALAKAVTEGEIDEAAVYFAGLKPVSYLKIVESTTVPKTVVAGWTLTTPPEGGNEPLASRIIEMPLEFQRFENRDSRTPYIAYVPVGSIKRGAELVATGGGGKTVQCATCHGPDLRGLADVPRLIGRSPSYLMRQLYDLKTGSRKGGTAELMKPVVAHLSNEDMTDIVAYLASRGP